MDNTVNNELDLDQRKAQIKAKLEQSWLLIRNDVNDLKEDLNPLQAAGNLVKTNAEPSPGRTVDQFRNSEFYHRHWYQYTDQPVSPGCE